MRISIEEHNALNRKALDWELLYQDSCHEVGGLEAEIAELKEVNESLKAAASAAIKNRKTDKTEFDELSKWHVKSTQLGNEQAAHIDRLREAIEPFVDLPSCSKQETVILDNAETAYNSTPKQSLAHIQADAIDKVANKWLLDEHSSQSARQLRWEAEQLRKGE